MKKRSKNVTKKEATKLVEKLMLKYYTKGMANQLEVLRSLVDADSELGRFKTDTRNTLSGMRHEMDGLRKHLTTLVEEVMIHDYIIGRTTRNDLVAALREIHKDDMLSVTEHLEEIDQQKDKVLARLKKSKKKEQPAFECYHANENPATCPCPKKCYCKDNTCKGKVSW